MKLTEENKREIDSMDYEGLLRRWRFSRSGDPWFEGETGAYWKDRMAQLREQPGGQAMRVAASKSIGW